MCAMFGYPAASYTVVHGSSRRFPLVQYCENPAPPVNASAPSVMSSFLCVRWK